MPSASLLALTGIATYSLCTWRTKDHLNPCGTLSLLWFLAAALSDIPQLKDQTLQQPWAAETYLSIYISGISVFLCGFILQKRTANRSFTLNPSYFYKAISSALMSLSIIAVLIRASSTNWTLSSVFEALGTTDIKAETGAGIPVIHYFELLTPYLALAAFFELRTSITTNSTRKAILYSYIAFAIIFYCILFGASRGSLLIFLLGSLYLYSRQGAIRPRGVIILGALLLIFLTVFSFIRTPSSSLTNSFFGESFLSYFFSPIYTYVALNFNNLNQLILSSTDHSYFFYALKFLLWPLLKSDYEQGKIVLQNFDTLFFNARTWIYGFYHDLGLLGCIIYPTAVAISLSLLHNASQTQPRYILSLMALQKAVVFTFFGNYFFGELVLIAPLLIVLLLSFLYTKKLRL